jgi:hypothetical protein
MKKKRVPSCVYCRTVVIAVAGQGGTLEAAKENHERKMRVIERLPGVSVARSKEGQMPEDRLGRLLKRIAKEHGKTKFKPGYFYNTEGDQIEVYLENVNYYAQWVNHDVTILRAQNDDRIVGLEVHGVKKQVVDK